MNTVTLELTPLEVQVVKYALDLDYWTTTQEQPAWDIHHTNVGRLLSKIEALKVEKINDPFHTHLDSLSGKDYQAYLDNIVEKRAAKFATN